MAERKAFTLMEMLVVIAIVTLLAVIAIGSYGSARRSAQIDLIADNLVSVLKQQQELSKSGKVGPADEEESVSKCYGMYFGKGTTQEEGAQVKIIDTPYYPVRGQDADICDLGNYAATDFAADSDFELFQIEMYQEGIESDNLIILFKPPFARVAIGQFALGEDTNVSAPGIHFSPFITIGVRLPSGENEKFLRFDASTGLIDRYYEETL